MSECICVLKSFGPDILQPEISGKRFTLKDAVVVWLNENVGRQKWTWEKAWHPHNNDELGGRWVVEFRFWDTTHATLFKLAWC